MLSGPLGLESTRDFRATAEFHGDSSCVLVALRLPLHPLLQRLFADYPPLVADELLEDLNPLFRRSPYFAPELEESSLHLDGKCLLEPPDNLQYFAQLK